MLEQDMTVDTHDADHRRRRWLSALVASRQGRVLSGLITVALMSSLGLLATQAAFTDSVSMAEISVTGGTLDLKANGGDGPNQAWTGTLSAAVGNMKPGDEASGTVNLKNNGTLPLSITVSTTGTDASSCFVYYFRETSIVTGAGNATPGNLAGMGTAAGGDGTMAAFATAITNVQLPDNGTDISWEPHATDTTIRDEKQYTLTVRLKSACTTQSSNGLLNFTFNAAQ